MARPLHAPSKLVLQTFEPLSTTCLVCGNAAHIAYHTQRTITTLTGRHHLHFAVRRCISPECSRYHRPYRPEAEGAWALPPVNLTPVGLMCSHPIFHLLHQF